MKGKGLHSASPFPSPPPTDLEKILKIDNTHAHRHKNVPIRKDLSLSSHSACDLVNNAYIVQIASRSGVLFIPSN